MVESSEVPVRGRVELEEKEGIKPLLEGIIFKPETKQ
jgi:hypothetical protein